MVEARARSDESAEVRVIGARRRPLRDLYHRFLRATWRAALGAIVAAWLGLNVVFALGYFAAGGIANARPGSFADAFYFSVHTLGTIGYGSMHPEGDLANALVVLESVAGLLFTAIATGLVFAKFSQVGSRIVFSRCVTVAPMDGVPTLMIRLGNDRESMVIEAQIRVSLVRTERTKEGMVFYRMLDLALTRDRSPALSRSWTAMHPITPASPLFGHTPESLLADEVELIVTVVGIDDTSLQSVHGRRRYTHEDIVWGARHADIIEVAPDDALIIDLTKFHELTPTAPTSDFPYPAAKR